MRWPWRKRRQTDKGWFESGLFTIMGPAQVGDVNAPLTYEPTPEDLRCPRCGRPWDEHEVVRTHNRTVAHCPV